VFQDFMTAVMAEKEAKDGLKMLKDSTGFDPEKDISTILIAVPPDVEKSENFLFVAKATVDEAKLIAYAKSEGAKLTEQTHEKVKYYEIDGEGGMAFVDGYILVAPKAAMKAAIETYKGKGTALKKNKDFSALVKTVDTSANIWVAATLPAEIRKEMAKENPMAGDIEKVHASLDFVSGLKLRLSLLTASADTAKQLVELANAGIQGAGSDPSVKAMGFEPVIKGMKIAANGNDIEVSLDINETDLAAIKQTIQNMIQGGMR